MDVFCNRKQAMEANYVVMIPPSKPLNPLRVLTGVTEAQLKTLKEKYKNLLVFKKEQTND